MKRHLISVSIFLWSMTCDDHTQNIPALEMTDAFLIFTPDQFQGIYAGSSAGSSRIIAVTNQHCIPLGSAKNSLGNDMMIDKYILTAQKYPAKVEFKCAFTY